MSHDGVAGSIHDQLTSQPSYQEAHKLLECLIFDYMREVPQSISRLSDIFGKLKSFPEILVKTLNKWQPPQFVGIGQTGTGKSSVLDRLLNMPLLPRAGICKRVPIKLRLRFAERAQTPTLQVYNILAKTAEEGPFAILLQPDFLELQKKMEEMILKLQSQTLDASSNKIIILDMADPDLPSLDLWDMPGLVAEPQDMEQVTRSLIETQAERCGANSMYLLVVSAKESGALCNSAAMRLVQRFGLQEDTLGVVTMCDQADDPDLPALRRLLGLDPPAADGGPGESADASLSPSLADRGWVATANKAAPGDAESNKGHLLAQAKAEEGHLEATLPGAVAAGKASGTVLFDRFNRMYLRYVRKTWVPIALSELESEAKELEEKVAQLEPPAISCAEERGQACREVDRIVTERGPTIDDACCTEVLAPLRQRLSGIVQSRVESVAMSSLQKIWLSERGELEAACREAAVKWAARWAAMLRSTLADEGEGDVRGQRKRKAGGRAAEASFRLDRVPHFIEAIVQRSAELLEEARAAIQADVAACADSFYSCASPLVRATPSSERPSALDVTRDAGVLVDKVLLAFHLHGSVAQPLIDSLEGVAAGVDALERSRLQGLLAQLRAADQDISMMLEEVPGVLKGHTKDLRSVEWSQDGKLLATAGDDGTVRLWNTASTLEMAVLQKPSIQDCPHRVNKVSFSPDGKLLASCSENEWQIWDVSSRSLLLALPVCCQGSLESLAWRGDGQQLACCGESFLSAWSFSPSMLTETPGNVANLSVQSFTKGLCEMFAVKYHPDGTWIATGGSNGALYVWDAENIGSGYARHLTGHTKDVLGVAWSPDGLRLASLSYDCTVRLWSMSESSTFDSESAVIKCESAFNGRGLAFSPDGSLLAVSSSTGARLFDTGTLAEAAVLEDGVSTVTELAFSPCGKLLARALAIYRPGGVASLDATVTAQPLLGDAAHLHAAVFSKVPVSRTCGEPPATAAKPGSRTTCKSLYPESKPPGSDSDSSEEAVRSVRHRPG